MKTRFLLLSLTVGTLSLSAPQAGELGRGEPVKLEKVELPTLAPMVVPADAFIDVPENSALQTPPRESRSPSKSESQTIQLEPKPVVNSSPQFLFEDVTERQEPPPKKRTMEQRQATFEALRQSLGGKPVKER